MNAKSILILVFAFVLSACSTPQMAVSEQLQSQASAYEVKGRQGWLLKQQLSFGPYRTGTVKRGWTKGYDIPFILRFSGAGERLQFEISGQTGATAEVFCLGKLAETDLTWFSEYFDINLRAKDVFSGAIVLDERRNFTFVVENLNQNNHFREARGYLYGSDTRMQIQPVMKLQGDKAWLGRQAPGFEFIVEDRVIGAVETLNQGQVWINNRLQTDQQLLAAALSAALLLRSELEEAAEQGD